MREIVTDEITRSTKPLELRLENMNSTLSELKINLKTMNSIVESRSLKTSKSGKQSVVETKIENFQFIYDKHLVVHVTEKCVVGKAMKLIFRSKDGTFLEKVSFVLKSMLFAKLPQDKKSEFLTQAGMQYCSLRRSMARTALSHVEQNKFNRFRQQTGNDRSGSRSSLATLTDVSVKEDLKDFKIDRPFWCKLNYVRSEHLEEVQRRLETLHSHERKGKGKVTDLQEDHQLAICVSKKIFNLMTTVLTRSRERSKKLLFEQIGFLFTYWPSYGVTLNQKRTKFVWASEDTYEESEFDSIAPPYATEVELNSSEQYRRTVKKDNNLKWTKLLSDNSQFLLFARYEVSVRTVKDTKNSKNSNRQPTSVQDDSLEDDESSEAPFSNSPKVPDDEIEKYVHAVAEGDVRTMYRAFNILDISAQFISNYCSSKYNDHGFDIFCSSPDIFRLVVSIAILMKKWIRKLVEDYNEEGPTAFIEGESDSKNREIESYNFSKMFPCHTKKHSILFRNCLGVSKEEFSDDCLEQKFQELFAPPRHEDMADEGDDDSGVGQSNILIDDVDNLEQAPVEEEAEDEDDYT